LAHRHPHPAPQGPLQNCIGNKEEKIHHRDKELEEVAQRFDFSFLPSQKKEFFSL
jgi:hypothetical protein